MRYSFVPTIKTPSGKNAYQNVRYPEIPYREDDVYIYVTDTDRYDRLADRFYEDQNLWWIIPAANPSLPFNTLFPPTEKRIRIPVSHIPALAEFERLNDTPVDLVYSGDILNINVGRSGLDFQLKDNYTFNQNQLVANQRLIDENGTVRYSSTDLNTLTSQNENPTTNFSLY